MTIRNLDALIRPQRVLALGTPQGARERQVLDNLRASLPAEHWKQVHGSHEGETADLAVLLDPGEATPARIDRLGASGVRALLMPGNGEPSVAQMAAARRHLMRILGFRSAGVVNTGRLNASSLHLPPLPGRTALIAQSQSVAAAALDFAVGLRLGFSWIAVTGAESDVDVADLLDYAALDPHTQAVAVQLACIRGARKFMSAARACARAKPVVLLQTPFGDDAGPDPARSAAFARAGMVECESLPGLFDALAALQRLPSLGRYRVLVAGNGYGICALAVDAVRRHGLDAALPQAALQEALRRCVPEVRIAPGSVDLGHAEAHRVVEALRAILAADCADAVVLVHSPEAGGTHEALAAALAAAALGPRLLTVWLGMETAQAARKRSAEAELATFTSPDAAARALRFRHLYSRNQELLTDTPPNDPLPARIPEGITRVLRRYAAERRDRLSAPRIGRALNDYGVRTLRRAPQEALCLDIAFVCHPELGMHLRVARSGDPGRPPACAFTPLDPLLALQTLESAGLSPCTTGEGRCNALADLLVRLSRLLMEQPLIDSAEFRVCAYDDEASVITPATLRVRAQGLPERARLALAPYPARLTHEVELAGGRSYVIRAIRPADEPELIRLLESMRPEDIRLRFFRYIRHFSHAMAARMTQIDYDRELSLVAIPQEGSAGDVVGIATLVADPDGAKAEFAIMVHHAHGGLGLGRHLVDDLLAHAYESDIGLVYGEVLHENIAMLKLTAALGFRHRIDPDDAGCVHAEIEPARMALPPARCWA